MPVKVVFVTTTLDVGGAERQLYYLIRELPRWKYSVYVVTLRPGEALRTQFEEAGATIVPIYKRCKFDATVLFRLRRFLRATRPDIVQCQMYTANMWGRAAAILAGCRRIIISERNAEEEWKTTAHFAIEKLLNRCASSYLGNSQRVCRYCEANLGLPYGTFRLMYNGVDTEEFRPTSPADRPANASPVIGTIANLYPRKDLGTFLYMAAYILERAPHAKFKLVGSGPEKDSLVRLATDLGIAGRVEFAGPSTNAKDLLNGFDVFVLSSRNEGFANVIVEAMSSGLPVVATDVGGAREAIKEGRTGFVVPPRNPQALAERVVRLLDNPGLRFGMGRAGRERAVREFSLHAMVRRYDELYDELMRSTPSFLNFRVTADQQYIRAQR